MAVLGETFLYLVTYRATARNVSADALASALGAIARDASTETLLGLVPLNDQTTSLTPFATRGISYTSAPGALVPDPQLGSFLTNYYTASFAEQLGTPVVPSPVSIVQAPARPVLWVRADVGAPNPVSSWADLSGHGHDLAQLSGPAQPSLAIDSGIQQIVAQFSGGQLLSTGGSLAFDSFTYLASFAGELGQPAGLLFERGPDATANPGENLYTSTTTAHTAVATRSSTTHSLDLGVGWGQAGFWQIAAYTYSHAHGGKLYVGDLSTPAASFAALPAATASQALHVGGRLGGSLPFTGSLRELFVFDVELSASDLVALGPYLRSQIF